MTNDQLLEDAWSDALTTQFLGVPVDQRKEELRQLASINPCMARRVYTAMQKLRRHVEYDPEWTAEEVPLDGNEP